MTSSNLHGPVVVGMDGSEEAVRAADYGAWEAHRRRVPLRLVLAHRTTSLWGPGALIADDDAADHDWIRHIMTRAEEDIAATHPDVTVETVVVSDGAAAALVDESDHAGLVVVGTRATAGLMAHLSGSVAVQVAAHAHTPVVVVRTKHPAEPAAPTGADPAILASRPVLVGMDGSTESEQALAFAVEEAVARDTDVVAVYAWNVLEVRDTGPIVPDGYDTAEEEAKALRLLTEATEGWSDRYPSLAIRRRLIHSLDPVDAITRASADAGLIVVGPRGHGGFLGLRLGSTVDRLIRHTGAPVAVVHGEAAAP